MRMGKLILQFKYFLNIKYINRIPSLIIVQKEKKKTTMKSLGDIYSIFFWEVGIDNLYKNDNFDSIINDFLLIGRDLLPWTIILHLKCSLVR